MIPKFRGISISDENKGQWVYGNLIVDGNYAYIVNGVIECNDQYITIAEWCPVDLKTIGASTGLFDKSGVEIFEGDVVRFTVVNQAMCGIYEVRQAKSGAWRMDNAIQGREIWLAKPHSLEVIGNIHEHPELVEVAYDQ